MLTIGADPELFVYENNQLSAGIGKVGGTKERPYHYLGVPIQEDNVLVEFNTRPKGLAGLGFVREVNNALNKVREYCQTLGLEVRIETSNKYDLDQLKKYGRGAMEFGCDPDYNAHTRDINPTPDPNTNVRTAGGHIHIGHNNKGNQLYDMAIVRACDLFMGVPSVLMDDDIDRRSVYGNAGAYRSKDYGVEYRTLSNFWLRSDDYIEWVTVQSRAAVKKAGIIDALVRKEWPTVTSCINDSDHDKARYLINKFNLEVA